MSDINHAEGRECYETSDEEGRAWFEDQWRQWPRRVHEDRTTNISFHHGGVTAFRVAHGRDPEMSNDFRGHVAYLDGFSRTPPKQGR